MGRLPSTHPASDPRVDRLEGLCAAVRNARAQARMRIADAAGVRMSTAFPAQGLPDHALAVFFGTDLVSVAVYDARHIDQELAMAFGDEFALPAVKSFALADFCDSPCGRLRANSSSCANGRGKRRGRRTRCTGGGAALCSCPGGLRGGEGGFSVGAGEGNCPVSGGSLLRGGPISRC